jgi:FkbM family methyltransferase
MIKYLLALSALLAVENLEARLFSQPPHQNVLPITLKFDHILSFDEESRSKITAYVQSFPANNYDIHLVRDLGLFWLEPKQEYIKDILKRDEKWEPHVEAEIKKHTKPGSIAIDIGAHIGTQTIIMARAVGEQGKVIAFEPQLKIFRELFMNLELNQAPNVYYFWGAISDKPGVVKLPNLRDSCEVVSFLDFTTGYSGVDAPAGTLDSLELKNVSLIKIDVDGIEDIVLDGIKNTILSNKPVIIIEIQGGYSIETAPPEIVEKILHTKSTLTNLGYTLHRISGIDYLGIPNDQNR